MEIELNAKEMCELFKNKKPFLIGRNGTVELEGLICHFFDETMSINKLRQLNFNAGIFPLKMLDCFFKTYLEVLKNCDMIAEGWYKPLQAREKTILDSLNKDRKSILLRNLEPYYVKPEYRWTKYLENRRVAIINSFADLCESQTYLSKAIWPNDSESLLPSSTTWIPIRTYYSPELANGKCGWPDSVKNWKDAVKYVVEKVIEESCDTAIIGCGGLGMIIGHELKNKGLQCIVMGGATQILFGVYGKRWENHEIISKFFNNAWIKPDDEHTPNNSKIVENGCYW